MESREIVRTDFFNLSIAAIHEICIANSTAKMSAQQLGLSPAVFAKCLGMFFYKGERLYHKMLHNMPREEAKAYWGSEAYAQPFKKPVFSSDLYTLVEIREAFKKYPSFDQAAYELMVHPIRYGDTKGLLEYLKLFYKNENKETIFEIVKNLSDEKATKINRILRVSQKKRVKDYSSLVPMASQPSLTKPIIKKYPHRNAYETPAMRRIREANSARDQEVHESESFSTAKVTHNFQLFKGASTRTETQKEDNDYLNFLNLGPD